MMILNMIEDAASEDEIHILLSSYVEAVRGGGDAGCLPHSISAAPPNGRRDIEACVTALGGELYVTLPQSAEKAAYVELLGEALSVFSTALLKLRRMEAAALHAG